MKIQCDVCEKVEASLFCPSDEAALCHGCDLSIHHANKLATKHTRFSLIHLHSKEFPLCDICQEKRGYVFCQEDRAIVCRECDLSIHRANEHTEKHNRFLLSGVKVSSNSLDPESSSSTNMRSRNSNENGSNKVEENMGSESGSASTSSISEYLIETIPGYCFEDFLDASFPPNAFCKNNCSESKDQDIHVSKFLFPQVNLAQVQSTQLTSPIPLNLPRIGSTVGVKDIPNVNISIGKSRHSR